MQESRVVINDLAEAKLIGQIREDKFQAIAYWLSHNHPVYMPPQRQFNTFEPVQKLNPEQEQMLTRVLQSVAMSISPMFQEKIINPNQQAYDSSKSTIKSARTITKPVSGGTNQN